jgi:hypothetical protein
VFGRSARECCNYHRWRNTGDAKTGRKGLFAFSNLGDPEKKGGLQGFISNVEMYRSTHKKYK